MDRKKSTSISYSEVGMLSKITRDYLANKETVKSFYDWDSNASNIQKVIDEKSDFSLETREILVQVLTEQYVDLASPLVKKNMDLLLSRNTYTITTGHQLNLFTGPLYFIYKIVSAIQTAKLLSVEYPKMNFIPVYWMATEDHDFDEINHAFVGDKKIQWNSDQSGMVGEFSLDGIEAAVEEFCNALGDSLSAREMAELIRKAYLNQSNLADATRFLVHELFKDYGLVIVDANNRKLKQLFAPIVKRELKEQVSFRTVSNTLKEFGKTFSAQVSPREINLFYVKQGLRERILKTEQGYLVNNSEITFDENQMDLEIENHPERFSPNVILRPVYEELILPNLVYIGGGAEVAYWLELKATFEAFNVPFPLVQIRSSFLTLSPKSIDRIQELNWTTRDVYRKKQDLVMRFTNDVNPLETKISEVKIKLNLELEKLGLSLTEYDSELERSLKASQRGMEKSMDRLSKKVSGAVKRHNQDHMHKMDQVWDAVNPFGVYQERHVNFFEMYATYGTEFVNRIRTETEPFCKDFRVVEL